MTSLVLAPTPPRRLWTALLALGLGSYALATPYFLQVFQGLVEKAGKPLPPVPVLFLAEGLKMLVLCGLAAWAGVAAAPRAGLDAPLLRTRLAGAPIGRGLLALVPRALAYGTVGSVAVVALNLALASSLPPAMRLDSLQGGEGGRLEGFLVGATGLPAIAYVVVANSLVGLLCGVLFFRRGLEQASLAHAWADVALHALLLV